MRLFEDEPTTVEPTTAAPVLPELDANSFWGQIMEKINQFFAFIQGLFAKIQEVFAGLGKK